MKKIIILTTIFCLLVTTNSYAITEKHNINKTERIINNLQSTKYLKEYVLKQEQIKAKKLKIQREKQQEKARQKKIAEYEAHWGSLGKCRITTYCPWCNDPVGSYQSSSGVRLYEGCVACNWLPIGTKLRINGVEYTVLDTCGTDAIDIFVDTDSCHCHTNYYTNVEIFNK